MAKTLNIFSYCLAVTEELLVVSWVLFSVALFPAEARGITIFAKGAKSRNLTGAFCKLKLKSCLPLYPSRGQVTQGNMNTSECWMETETKYSVLRCCPLHVKWVRLVPLVPSGAQRFQKGVQESSRKIGGPLAEKYPFTPSLHGNVGPEIHPLFLRKAGNRAGTRFQGSCEHAAERVVS